MNTYIDEDTSAPVPIIRLWDSLLVPLQGDLTDAQATMLSADVLRKIERRNCAALIIDVSGLWLVDSHLCSVIADLARSASLMGTKTVLSGLQPEVTLTLLAMDVTLEGIETALNLEQALEGIGIRGPERDELSGTEFDFLTTTTALTDHQETSSE